MLTRIKLALCLIMASVASMPASATLITVNWTGSVVQSGIAGTIDIGDTISGHYTFDDTAAILTGHTFPDRSFYTYDTGHTSHFSVNGLSGYTTDNRIFVFDNGPGGDQFDTRNGQGTYVGDLLDGYTPRIFVRFTDSTETVFNTADLHNNLSAVDFDFLEVSRLDLNIGVDVRFHVTDFSFSGAGVPEPTTLALLMLGLFGIGLRKDRKIPN